MKHYLKSKDGEIKYTVDMYCEHPNMKNNNTENYIQLRLLSCEENL